MSAVHTIAEDQRQTGPQRRDLGQRQIHEDHFALDHMKPEIRVDPGQDQACQEWHRHHVQKLGHAQTPLICLKFVSKKSKKSSVSGISPGFCAIVMTGIPSRLASVSAAPLE